MKTRLKIEFLPSPHHRSRGGQGVDLIILHSISCPPGKFGTGEVADLFLDRLDYSRHPAYRELERKKLSAHFFINRRGALTQFVETGRAAYHAGRSRWEGRKECNNFSIGIELEGDDSHDFTGRQYRKLGVLCRDLMRSHPAITRERIVGHSDVAPERKADPGPRFDWRLFRRLLAAALRQERHQHSSVKKRTG